MQNKLLVCWMICLLSLSLTVARAAADKAKPKPETAKTTTADSAAEKAADSAAEKAAEKADSDKSKKADSDKSKKAEPEVKKTDKPKKAEPSQEKAKPKQSKAAKSKEKPAKKPEPKKPTPKKPTPKKPTVVRFTLRGDYPEGPVPIGLFGELQESLASVIRRMDHAAEDKAVAAVLLRIEGLPVGRGKLNELRSAVGRLRKAGKPVYAELTGADGTQYLLAAACNEIVMPPSGILTVTGVRAEIMFFKGLLDKLGIKADFMQMGKYKGAGEPYSRTEMSPALRESLEALMDDYYEQMVAEIAKDRKFEAAKVKTLVDRGIFTAAAAKKAGLIDHVVYADQFQETLKKTLKTDDFKLVTRYKKKKVSTDFSGIGGMMKLMEVMFGGKSAVRTGKAKKLAVIYAVGMIIPGKSTSDIFGSRAVGSTTLVKALRTAADDESVKAIVLRVDSPGGSAVASDLIWREVVRIKKPIIASMGNVAGSGGYYISMGADKILAEPGTVTGSIGVIGGKLVTGGLYDKIGVTTDVISRGKNSGSFSPTKPFSPRQRNAWRTILEDIYHQFVAKAAEGRKMPYEKLEQLAQGRVYTGNMAKNNGLIDDLGTLHDAIADAKKAAGLKPDEKVDLLILPRPKTVLEQLFGDPAASGRLGAAGELIRTLSEVQLLRRLFSEPALTLMPYRVELK